MHSSMIGWEPVNVIVDAFLIMAVVISPRNHILQGTRAWARHRAQSAESAA